MRVGLYNPYHDTLGGGEQYIFTFASYFLQKKNTVIYFTSDSREIGKAQERFDFDLSGTRVHPIEPGVKGRLLQAQITHSLDILLYYSDGSLPLSFAKKTYIIFQFPIPGLASESFLSKLKKSRITDVVVNSKFTKKFIDKKFSVNAKIIHPAIDTKAYKAGSKKNVIITVGRFTQGMNMKRHDILIKAFKRLINEGLNDWKFVIAGGVRKEDYSVVSSLNKSVDSYPIQIIPNIDRLELLSLYEHAQIYWHAAGFEVDEEKNPENVEHFGITTLEAMASGAVPMVYPAGGQKEIVLDSINGLWWKTTDELVLKTKEIISDKVKLKEYKENSLNFSKNYDRKKFYLLCQEFFDTVKGL